MFLNPLLQFPINAFETIIRGVIEVPGNLLETLDPLQGNENFSNLVLRKRFEV